MQVVAACGTWCFGLQVVGLVWSYRLCVRFAGCCSVNLRKRKGTMNLKRKHYITLWRTGFGRFNGPAERQTNERMNEKFRETRRIA